MTGKSILYAEDEFTNRRIMEIQCRRYGVECILVEGGREALERIAERDFDLIVLDQYMPGLNGDEVARAIRSEDVATPMIAITSDDGCVGRLKESGFDAVFVKPLRAAEYREILEAHLK
jgi:CheY-like chemotaxis protein